MIWRFEDQRSILESLRPQIGSHDWALRLARWGEGRPTLVKKGIQSIVKRAINPRRPYFLLECNGVQVVGDRFDRYSRMLALNPRYEAASIGHILQSLEARPGAFIDVGANMGVIAATVGGAISEPVVAIEPDLATARRAACAFALNDLRNGLVFNGAAGDTCGEVAFFTTPGSSDAASLSAEPDATKTIVSLITIDALVEQLKLDKVGFIKIDVEGFEPQVLTGANRTIREHRPDIYFEYHWDIAPAKGWSAEDARDQIEAYAPYDYCVVREDDPIRPFPPTPDVRPNVNIWCRAKTNLG